MLLLEVNWHKNSVVGKKKVFYAKTSNSNKHFIAGGTRGKVRILKRKIKLGKPQLHSTRRGHIIINIYNLFCFALLIGGRSITRLQNSPYFSCSSSTRESWSVGKTNKVLDWGAFASCALRAKISRERLEIEFEGKADCFPVYFITGSMGGDILYLYIHLSE